MRGGVGAKVIVMGMGQGQGQYENNSTLWQRLMGVRTETGSSIVFIEYKDIVGTHKPPRKGVPSLNQRAGKRAPIEKFGSFRP